MNKHGPTVEVKAFAQRLIEMEKADESAEHSLSEAQRVCQKLRRPISTLAGDAGFRALLVRALYLARLEAKALSEAKIKLDGTLAGLEQIPPEVATAAGIALVAQLVGLLVTFLGESLTLQLIQEQWPNMPDNQARET